MRSFIVSAAVALGFMAAGYSTPALAWGNTAHEIICEIAFQELNDKARAEVIRLMRGDEAFSQFNASCVWADHPRKRASEHFVNIPRDVAAFPDDACPLADKCLISAIKNDVEVLEGATSDDEKRAALKFLGHWVGDIHQPLHVSFEDDRGGNLVKESGSPCRYSLHSVWDTCIVERAVGTDIMNTAKSLRDGVSASERAAWQASSIVDWANESLTITRSASVEYCVQVGSECRYEANNPTYDDGETVKVVTVDDRYIAVHAPTVEMRMQQAGVRLGYLLNRAFGM